MSDRAYARKIEERTNAVEKYAQKQAGTVARDVLASLIRK